MMANGRLPLHTIYSALALTAVIHNGIYQAFKENLESVAFNDWL